MPNCLASVRTKTEEIHCDRLQIGVYTFGEELTQVEKNAIQNYSLKTNSYYHDAIVCSSLLRRSFLKQHNCYFNYPSISHGEDSLYMIEFVQQLPYTECYDLPLYLYRTRPESAQHSQKTQNKEKQLRSYLQVTIVMKQYFDAGTKTPEKTANMLMTYLWNTLSGAIGVPKKLRQEIINELIAYGLFPFRRPAACTHMRSYQTTRTDIVGKVFVKIYINMHRPWGFAAMVVLQKLIKAKKKLVK